MSVNPPRTKSSTRRTPRRAARAWATRVAAARIAGAVLDVFIDEPLPPDSPLYDTSNLILTPHTSWSSDQVVERSVRLFVENLRRFAAGQPLENVVDLEAGY